MEVYTHTHTHTLSFSFSVRSRVVQTCFKYGSNADRDLILKELHGHVVAVAESKYSHFLLLKILKHANDAQRDAVISEFYGRVKQLSHHKEASQVLDVQSQEKLLGKKMNRMERFQSHQKNMQINLNVKMSTLGPSTLSSQQ